ncbi:TetR/AcrR family transcriptional regulator [Sodalis ligni]|uniref:TetR/AcrR family transcriptional regulator n=1 Tax=Sodalis ligni TaxID=2697027 RepID=UPI00193FB329|nr:TetR/AcrR family transcriptional regulator [Sodalis ligni]QWA09701.1 TetR/AcrR family transcriptional regulator [Sodalis ligni]
MGRHREFDAEEALEAALSVFWQKGYEGTSFEDLTQATGVARPGLYAAFGNKEALFFQALDLYDKRYLGFMAQALDEPTSYKVVERILRGCAVLHTLSPSHPGCLGLNGALACSDGAESVRQELIRRRAASQLALCRRLERAQREGDLLPSAGCDTLAEYVMTVSQGMAVQAKAGVSRQSLEKLAEHVLSTWPASPSR